ncbi:hypothetical protein HETIRDRAFT_454954 [Heterobasidion irregulare TC 32-1]|uniref:Uncharacterized protein n=1 Tax=Heterobasidion irregulare (strain TC 32-1) TaxID=747525 RepID=W4JSD3_HETIT|nr:uncharacterized protein HETIRDRAFT_454954 [Heterobasidion irregulare TC 32-1]ETW76359.1 hypothetical protein HETIRDRAFT_454954 [Heterobasidion irregulare TC 32-1]
MSAQTARGGSRRRTCSNFPPPPPPPPLPLFPETASACLPSQGALQGETSAKEPPSPFARDFFCKRTVARGAGEALLLLSFWRGASQPVLVATRPSSVRSFSSSSSFSSPSSSLPFSKKIQPVRAAVCPYSTLFL